MTAAVNLPQLGPEVQEARIGEIYVKEGDSVEIDQDLVQLESDKATLDLPSSIEGKVTKIHVSEGDTVKVGGVILEIDELEEQQAKESDEADDEAASEQGEDEHGQDEHGQDEHGQDEHGQDEQRTEDPTRSPWDEGQDDATSQSRMPTERAGEQREALSGPRRDLAANLQTSWREIPQVTHFQRVDITALENMRVELNRDLSQEEHVTLTAILTRILASLLPKYPHLNASYDAEKEEIILWQKVNIGVARETTQGPMFPVLAEANRCNLIDIAKWLNQLKRPTSSETVTPDPDRGTFTLSNVGTAGGDYFTPIVHYPESAILGVGKVREEEGRFILPLSLSYDQQVVSGVEAAMFCHELASDLASPSMYVSVL